MAKSIIPLSNLPVIDKNSNRLLHSDIYQNGTVILIDKPIEWSSFDVVRFVRHRIPAKKVGHAGTLDPLATGLLILCSGKATRTISQIQALPKTYVAKIQFGASTPTYDAEKEPDVLADWQHITQEELREAIEKQFIGTIFQIPPAYSAIRVKGQRLYKKARKGQEVDLPPRQITIHSVQIEEFSLPEITVRIRCGKGTYIRSFAHDLGIALKSRAHLRSLRRINTGHFSVENALTPDQLDERMKMKKDG